MIITSFISSIMSRIEAYRAYRMRVRELELLNDRELKELGISRADIHEIAAAH